jgi:virginiamycin B lyase
MPSTDSSELVPTGPRDPGGFQVKVLRRAARIERRRRRLRGAGWLLAVLVAVSMGTVLLTRPQDNTVNVSPAASPTVRVTTFTVPAGGSPWSIIGGGDGSVWYTQRPVSPDGVGAIVTITPDGRTVTFPLGSGATPAGIVASTDGGYWYTDPGRNVVGRITTAGAISEWKTPARPGEDIAFAPDDGVWFLEPDVDRVARVSSAGRITQFPLPAGRGAVGLAAQGGALWFGESAVAKLGRVSTTGSITEVDLPDPSERVTAVAVGPGSSVWYLASLPGGEGRLGRFAGTGELVEQSLVGQPARGLTLGPDGRVWTGGTTATSLTAATATRLQDEALPRPLAADSLATGSDNTLWVVDRAARLVAQVQSIR